MYGPAAFAVDQPAGRAQNRAGHASRSQWPTPIWSSHSGARAYLARATRRCDIATLVRERRDRCRDGCPTSGRVSPAALQALKQSPEVSAVVIVGAPPLEWSSRAAESCWPTGSPTSPRPQARRPADAIAGALRVGPHGGATTASWGFVRIAPSPRSPDNRGMLRGVPVVRPTRASSRDDVGRWTARSTTEAPLLVEPSANRRAGGRA
jgi:hypothetical protein